MSTKSIRYLSVLFLLSLAYFCCAKQTNNDLTVIGNILFADGIGRHAIELIDMLHDSLKINFISSRGSRDVNLKDVPLAVQKIIRSPDKDAGKVSFFVDLLWMQGRTLAQTVPSSTIKIAYSVCEATAIPPQWVELLNSKFDAVVVPDAFVEKVYSAQGVKIPIFVLPLPIYLDKFLQVPQKSKSNHPFTFGMSASFYPRKNFELLLAAFIQEFGNNPQVKLMLHSRGGNHMIAYMLQSQIARSRVTNVRLIQKSLSNEEYVQFMASLDCYAFISKGEAFSITPREAMALGIPCILSDNSAHTTICKTGLVRAVSSTIREAAPYSRILGGSYGSYFTPTLYNVRKALRDVYTRYSSWIQKAQEGRSWVQQYSAERLKKKYLSLMKPRRVILGDKNIVKGKYIMTTSKSLYRKYQTLAE